MTGILTQLYHLCDPNKTNTNIILWGPYCLMDQRKVEAIQRRVTKLITSLCESDSSTRLAELQLLSLNYRCQHGDMI